MLDIVRAQDPKINRHRRIPWILVRFVNNLPLGDFANTGQHVGAAQRREATQLDNFRLALCRAKKCPQIAGDRQVRGKLGALNRGKKFREGHGCRVLSVQNSIVSP
jgi:hypothetical protein